MAEVSLPASEKCAEPSLRSPRHVGGEVAEEFAPPRAFVSNKQHGESLPRFAALHGVF
jgi:hypothetical protein